MLGQGQTYTFSTIAGAVSANGGDGFNAITGLLLEPRGTAVDADGNIYIADFQANKVRKIDAKTGNISTVAGNGRPDDGAAPTATASGITYASGPGATIPVWGPQGLAYDKKNNALYITARSGHLVKRLDLKTGIMTTFAGVGGGNGAAGYSGDGGIATNAKIRNPGGVAVDSKGNVYITDTGNNRIRKVYVDTGIIKTVAGGGGVNVAGGYCGDGGVATSVCPGGTSPINKPEGVAVDSKDNIYIADTVNNRIRKVTFCSGAGCADTKGILSTVAGTCVSGIADYSGRAVACTTGTPAGGTVVPALTNLGVGGNPHPAINGPLIDGDPTMSTLNSPRAIAFDSAGNMYVADASSKFPVNPGGTNTVGTGRIRMLKYDSGSGTFTSISSVVGSGAYSSTSANQLLKIPANQGDGRPGQAVLLNTPIGIAVDANNNLIIGDSANGRVRMMDASAGLVSTIAGAPLSGGDGGPASGAKFSNPNGIVADSAGNIYIADTNNNRVRKISKADGSVSTIAGNGVAGSSGDGGPATGAQLNAPGCLATDGISLYIADRGSNRIRKMDLGLGTITTVVGAFVDSNGVVQAADGIGSSATHFILNAPRCVALDKSGNLYVADTGNNRIVRFASDGGIDIWGSGNALPGGDGFQVTDASVSFNAPQAIAVDPSGNTLYISDTGNHTIRTVDLKSLVVNTVVGQNASGFSGFNIAGAAVNQSTALAIDTPLGIGADDKGAVFADSVNARLLRYDLATGNAYRVAGQNAAGAIDVALEGKLATDVNLVSTRAVSIAADGTVYFTDAFGGVRKLTPSK